MIQTIQEAAEQYVFNSKHTGGIRVIEIEKAAFTAGAEWAAPMWIPVTERLPEFNTDVLVLRYNEYSKKYDRLIGRLHPAKEDGQLGGHRKTYDKYWSLPAIQLLHEIQYWMPMPAIPDSLLNFKP
ncbi:DUF551 domain-containing protein [Chitinophaga sp. CF418]|uniref:DUF551 domain-containing protein n=1 Tax=Chitinophaga sp. CF418 TaxID=1855287 RepID=UPI000922E620|nr:DUF551 domain-containing protein [Chitinophaga sp. CF418]SHN45899.1 Protein of unknown function [Chitinophaga sp. CF418]